ncbi:MAG TPA: group 1 truncated hemoglobin [Solirubrobacteraceae bacterium]|nr:group 1 truncated hemoglobin [Solirubrobacteraceae bacterium]
MATIYDDIGGAAGVATAVDDFYARLLRDPAIGQYFDGVSMPRQIQHFRAFLTAALGGPQRYLGRDVRDAHAGLGITGTAFDAAVGHLVATLRSLGVEAATITEIGTRLAPLRTQVVSA